MKKIFTIITIIFAFFITFSSAQCEVLKGGVVHDNGKTITPFYYQGKLNSYGIQYDDDLYHAYYYDTSGNLIQYDVLKNPRNTYPNWTISYDADKNIISKSKSISKTEQYIYNSDGTLKAHWVGNNCYDANGNLLSSKRELH